MKLFENIKNLKYIFKSVDDLRDSMEDFKLLTSEMTEQKEEFYKLRAQSSDSEEDKQKIQEQIKVCTDELVRIEKKYDKTYDCANYLMHKFIVKSKAEFMQEWFYLDRTITLQELSKVISNLGVKYKLYNEDQTVAVYFDADEDFPEDILIVVGIEDIWLKLYAYPVRCDIKNEEQKLRFLLECNNYNEQNRYHKVYIDSVGHVFVERQDFLECFNTSDSLSDKLGFSIGAAYNFFKERKDFFTEVIEYNKNL